MTVLKAPRWTGEERRFHRYLEAVWPAMLAVWTGLEQHFTSKPKVWRAWGHLSADDVPHIIVNFTYRANGGRLNRPPLDGIRKFLAAQAARSGLVAAQRQTGRSTVRATLRLPAAVVKSLAAEPTKKPPKKSRLSSAR